MSDLDDLYQQVILDHGRHPRNHFVPEQCTCTEEGYNPLCGDKVKVFLSVEDDKISDISFQAEGCAISVASASLMSGLLKGKTVNEAEYLFGAFHQMITKEGEANPALGKTILLAGVKSFPMRVKCATMAWHTFHKALQTACVNLQEETACV